MADNGYEGWLKRARAYRQALLRLEVTCPPAAQSNAASEEQARGAELLLGFSLPASFRTALTGFAARFEFRWSLKRVPRKGWKALLKGTRNLAPWVEVPEQFDTVYSGHCLWNIDSLAALEKTRQVWVEKVFSDPEKPFDRVWQNALLFAEIGNGDFLAVDRSASDGPVVYVCQEWSDLHGVRLGSTFLDFIDRWSRIGFVGPEDWQLSCFVPSAEEGIAPDGDAAKQWRAWLDVSL